MRATQLWYWILPWPTQVTISISWCHYSKTSSRATSWQYLNWTLLQGYPPSSSLHNWPSQKIYSIIDVVPVPIRYGTGPHIKGRVWGVSSPTVPHGSHHAIATKYHKEICAGVRGLLGNWRGGTLRKAMTTWTIHIDWFEWKYDNALAGNNFLVADIVDHIHKQLQVLLHLFNMTCLDNVDIGYLL